MTDLYRTNLIYQSSIKHAVMNMEGFPKSSDDSNINFCLYFVNIYAGQHYANPNLAQSVSFERRKLKI